MNEKYRRPGARARPASWADVTPKVLRDLGADDDLIARAIKSVEDVYDSREAMFGAMAFVQGWQEARAGLTVDEWKAFALELRAKSNKQSAVDHAIVYASGLGHGRDSAQAYADGWGDALAGVDDDD